jgi:hypothetical protein
VFHGRSCGVVVGSRGSGDLPASGVHCRRQGAGASRGLSRAFAGASKTAGVGLPLTDPAG